MTHPAIRELFQSISRQASFQELVRAISAGAQQPVSLSGLGTTAKALYLVLLWQLTERPIVLIVDGSKQAEALAELNLSVPKILEPWSAALELHVSAPPGMLTVSAALPAENPPPPGVHANALPDVPNGRLNVMAEPP